VKDAIDARHRAATVRASSTSPSMNSMRSRKPSHVRQAVGAEVLSNTRTRSPRAVRASAMCDTDEARSARYQECSHENVFWTVECGGIVPWWGSLRSPTLQAEAPLSSPRKQSVKCGRGAIAIRPLAGYAGWLCFGSRGDCPRGGAASCYRPVFQEWTHACGGHCIP